MKDQDIILRVQAFVDGELPEAEQGQMAALASRDPDIHALVKELKQTRQALAGYDETLELPESREFYWSRIQRRIESLPVEQPEPRGPSLLGTLARWLVPATCLAALVITGFVLLGGRPAADEGVNWQAAYDGVNALTYQDYDEGMTLLWLSYPADNAVANSEEAATFN
jgi:anti-sigma factor RsiW